MLDNHHPFPHLLEILNFPLRIISLPPKPVLQVEVTLCPAPALLPPPTGLFYHSGHGNPSRIHIIQLKQMIVHIFCWHCLGRWGFPGCSVVKNPSANAGDKGSILGSERFPGERNSNPIQYSCLGIPMNRGSWWAIVHGVANESDTI